MRLGEFDYHLPEERIAQHPLAERDGSRLLWLRRTEGALEDRQFHELPELLRAGDLLVANDSRVFPARLYGEVESTPVETLLLREVAAGEWSALARPGRKLPVGARIVFGSEVEAEVVAVGARGERRLRFHCQGELRPALERLGHVPLPPYIHRPGGQLPGGDADEDRLRYQTIFAGSAADSAAAPTAGLHFTPAILERLAVRGVELATVTLEIGLATFQPVTAPEIEDHPMHAERFQIGEAAANALNRARRERRRIVAVGTTAARVLETTAPASGEPFLPQSAESRLFLYPGRPFHVLDALLTNFHAPRSSLLMMVSAFAGAAAIRGAYRHALEAQYRFLSFGDCMLID